MPNVLGREFFGTAGDGWTGACSGVSQGGRAQDAAVRMRMERLSDSGGGGGGGADGDACRRRDAAVGVARAAGRGRLARGQANMIIEPDHSRLQPVNDLRPGAARYALQDPCRAGKLRCAALRCAALRYAASGAGAGAGRKSNRRPKSAAGSPRRRGLCVCLGCAAKGGREGGREGACIAGTGGCRGGPRRPHGTPCPSPRPRAAGPCPSAPPA